MIKVNWKHWGAHPELKRRIDEKFPTDDLRKIAWETVGIIREVFPETDDLFKGEFLGEGGD